jgi:hypothetical protein
MYRQKEIEIMKITTFDSKLDREMFQAAALKAIEAVAKEYGLAGVTNAGYVYDKLECTFKFKVMCDTQTPAAQHINFMNSMVAGFHENVVGKSFTDKGKVFTITGFSFNKRNSVDCTRADGKLFGYNADFVKKSCILF